MALAGLSNRVKQRARTAHPAALQGKATATELVLSCVSQPTSADHGRARLHGDSGVGSGDRPCSTTAAADWWERFGPIPSHMAAQMAAREPDRWGVARASPPTSNLPSVMRCCRPVRARRGAVAELILRQLAITVVRDWQRRFPDNLGADWLTASSLLPPDASVRVLVTDRVAVRTQRQNLVGVAPTLYAVE
jgi:hypothetical protein